MRSMLIPALLLMSATAATAQTAPAPMAMPQPACTTSAALPPAFASFAHPVPAAQGAGVFLGQAATLDLGPGTHFIVPPSYKPASETFGGTVGFDVTDPGTYQVAIGAGIWVDVVKGTAAVKASGHEHGPACTAVRKIVAFTLAPGHYTLQFSGSTTPSVTFQVAKAS